MKTFKDYLAEADYEFAQSGTSIPDDQQDAEYARRLKLFGYDHNGEGTFQVPFKDLWTGEEGYATEYTRHISLVDPDYKHKYAEMHWEDPANLKAQIEAVKTSKPGTWGTSDRMSDTAFKSARIATLTQGIKDAEHYQQIKDKIPQLLKQGSKPGKPGGKPSAQFDPKVKELQDKILAKDPNALPKYGADGLMGPETRAAMQRLGIKSDDSTLQRMKDLARFKS